MADAYDQLFEVMRTVYRALIDAGRGRGGDHELSLMASMVLGGINKEPGSTVSELARRLGVAKSHVSELVEDLSCKGFVTKQSDPQDKRVLRISMSAQGSEFIQHGNATLRQRFNEVVAGYPPEQAQRLATDLQQLHEVISRNRCRDRSNSSAPQV